MRLSDIRRHDNNTDQLIRVQLFSILTDDYGNDVDLWKPVEFHRAGKNDPTLNAAAYFKFGAWDEITSQDFH